VSQTSEISRSAKATPGKSDRRERYQAEISANLWRKCDPPDATGRGEEKRRAQMKKTLRPRCPETRMSALRQHVIQKQKHCDRAPTPSCSGEQRKRGTASPVIRDKLNNVVCGMTTSSRSQIVQTRARCHACRRKPEISVANGLSVSAAENGR